MSIIVGSKGLKHKGDFLRLLMTSEFMVNLINIGNLEMSKKSLFWTKKNTSEKVEL